MKRLLPILLLCLATPLSFTDVRAADPAFKATLSDAWRLSLRDTREHATADYDDNRWARVALPANLARLGVVRNRWVWLRRQVQLTDTKHLNLSLVLPAVYDEDEVYFNGTLIGRTRSNAKRPNNYGRPRIYGIPSNLIREGGQSNTIAIRMRGSFKNEIGILARAPSIQSTRDAQDAVRNPELKNLTYAAIYLVVGIFFVILYFRIKELPEYLYFGIFAIVFGLMVFTRNEFRFAIGDWFLFFKLLEQITYATLPTLFLIFFRQMFRIENKDLVLFGVDLRLAFLGYPILNAVTAVTLVVLFNPLWWDRIIGYWFFINIPFFAYYVYVTIQRTLDRAEIEAMIVGGGTLMMVAATVHFFAVERGVLEGPSYFNLFSLLFMLCVSLALIFRMIKLQQEVEDRQDRLNEVNELRDRVFSYVNTLVRKPAEDITRLGESLFEGKDDDFRRREIAEDLESEVDALGTDLDDILELSRLEVIQEAEYVETVNFNDFITAVIPQSGITCNIKVHPDIVLKTSLELVNSIVIRLIDFPGFKQFQHIDLIITSDLKQNVHFRFLLYHTNFRETRKLYELLTSKNPERGSLWVKWGIVREITRILNGALDISILGRKFLRIDIRLAAELPEEMAKAGRQATQIEVTRRQGEQDVAVALADTALLESEEMAVAGAAKSASAPGAPATPPKFSKDMSVGDFVSAISARLRRK